MAPASSKLTEQTLLHHWQAFGAGDVETIMSDYATDAVLITPDGTLKGSARIRSVFENIFASMFPPNSTSLKLLKQIVDGEMAYILWSGSSSLYNAPFCTDTFIGTSELVPFPTQAALLISFPVVLQMFARRFSRHGL